ncbi:MULTISPECIES: hypothetical protein [unclassified Arcicella]|uniref:hypothetical protein n=1 Tax=unclassified Arcicella TaxID=2644986 RepID=UPI00285E1F54|nr:MULTISPECIES: hypothetical protein [unclassified Arcicella]MDR6563429.1 hypothetical protein [Arcicella sp. BE51]MDR6813459.1 hypothetical protein [Arcicella sp. BE140]MDR6824772.1 hypothetical protein [Arcicella sp. BE139]
MKKILKNIYYTFEVGSYGLKILFDLNITLLLFDSVSFVYINKNEFDKFKNWKRLDYGKLLNGNIDITEIKEDELTSYFVKFSNDDILYIYQRIDGLEEFSQDFKIISKNMTDYNEVCKYMSEDWVEKVPLT